MKRVSWKRGMRLSDDLLRASDDNMAELISKAFILAANGRFGLLPSHQPFELTLNIGKGFVDVDSLTCLAMTKGGHLIDAQYDTRYNNNFDTRVMIPETLGVEEYILTINAQPGQWKDIPDGCEEPVYSFSLIAPDTIVPDNAVPIAHLVEEYGWRMDEEDFVPPCLFVSAHRKFEDLLSRFTEVLRFLDEKAQILAKSGIPNVVTVYWPFVQQLRIAADKERDFLTPMMLLSNVQKCVSAFTCACDLDPSIELSDAQMYRTYVLAPYNYREVYMRIKVGLDFCYTIVEKLERLVDNTPASVPPPAKPRSAKPKGPAKPKGSAAPRLMDESSVVICNTSETALPVLYQNASASIYFTTNGSQPTQKSSKAVKTRDGFMIKFDNGFRQEKGTESSKNITIKLMAMENGICSETSSYDVTLQKSQKIREAIPV